MQAGGKAGRVPDIRHHRREGRGHLCADHLRRERHHDPQVHGPHQGNKESKIKVIANFILFSEPRFIIKILSLL